MMEFGLDATLGELKNAMYMYDDDEILNMELTGKWYSYRGNYYEIAIEYVYRGQNHSTVGQLRDIIEDALEVGVMDGYKGGEFTVSENTVLCFSQGHQRTGGLYPVHITNSFDGVQISVHDDY